MTIPKQRIGGIRQAQYDRHSLAVLEFVVIQNSRPYRRLEPDLCLPARPVSECRWLEVAAKKASWHPSSRGAHPAKNGPLFLGRAQLSPLSHLPAFLSREGQRVSSLVATWIHHNCSTSVFNAKRYDSRQHPQAARHRAGARTPATNFVGTFLKAHWDVLAAIDFTTVEVWTKSGLQENDLRWRVLFAKRNSGICGSLPSREESPRRGQTRSSNRTKKSAKRPATLSAANGSPVCCGTTIATQRCDHSEGYGRAEERRYHSSVSPRFREWQRTIGGILQANGFDGFMHHMADTMEKADVGVQHLKQLIAAFYQKQELRQDANGSPQTSEATHGGSSNSQAA